MSESMEQVLAEECLREIRKNRQHNNVRTAGFILVIVGLYALNLLQGSAIDRNEKIPKGEKYAAYFRIDGAIKPGGATSLQGVQNGLEQAFADEDAEGVVLVINSPGGSPVQSSNINRLLYRLKDKYDKELVVVAEDLMASGGYLIGVAGDHVYVNESSIGGSIGVIQRSFGYVGLANKLGIQERVFTAGESKAGISAFSPVTEQDTVKVQKLLASVHEGFIAAVEEGRAEKIDAENQRIFSGEAFSGVEMVKLGLADGINDPESAALLHFDAQHFKNYTPRRSLFSKLGQSVLHTIVSEINGPGLLMYGQEYAGWK